MSILHAKKEQHDGIMASERESNTNAWLRRRMLLSRPAPLHIKIPAVIVDAEYSTQTMHSGAGEIPRLWGGVPSWAEGTTGGISEKGVSVIT